MSLVVAGRGLAMGWVMGLACWLGVLVWAQVAGAQVSGGGGGGVGITGDVEAVGFDQNYRPGVWTPLLVRLRPEQGKSGAYQIRVEQEDLDRDIISFVRPVSLTGASSGGGAGGGGGGGDQRFVVYFLPQGTRTVNGRGLPDRSQGSRLEQLNAVLRVWLCDDRGRKLVQLPIRNLVGSLEPVDKTPPRGTKLVLYVRESGSFPARRELSDMLALQGVTEDIGIVEVSPRTLPGSAIGYEGVDAVVWAAGGPPDVAISGDGARYRALREWLGGGGRLVVMQDSEWRRTAAWGELLPVRFVAGSNGEILGTVTRSDLSVLIRLSGAAEGSMGRGLWEGLRGSYVYGVTEPREGAVVEEWFEWRASGLTGTEAGGPPMKSVWMARQGVGAGSVTYVAQDLGSPTLVPRPTGAESLVAGSTLEAPGWARIWSRVLDYRYAPIVVSQQTADDVRMPYRTSRSAHELGSAVLSRMEMTSRAGALIAVSLVFFVLYWLAAGPGMWLFLRARGKQEWNWFGFAVVAAGGTLLTIVVVRVALMGSAEVRHFSLVRLSPGEPARVESRIGLYVPRDGDVEVSLPVGSGAHSSTIAPYAIHPGHAREVDQFAGNKRYELSMREVAGDEPSAVTIPFRSTMKRLQASWRGEIAGTISGTAAVVGSGQPLLSGRLNNGTGQDLTNVYLIFRSDRAPNPGQDRVIFLPRWGAGEQLRLEDLTDRRRMRRFDSPLGSPEAVATDAAAGSAAGGGAGGAGGGGGRGAGGGGGLPAVTWGLVGLPGREFDVERWIYADLRTRQMMLSTLAFDDSSRSVPRVWPVLSVFDRLPVMRNPVGGETRSELLRLNGRFLDVSSAVSAGGLVILGQVESAPLPVPLRVDGDTVGGQGMVVYQVVLPLDRREELKESEETEGSATQPAGEDEG